VVIRTRNHNVDVSTLPADSPLINTQPSQLPQKFILIVPTGKVIAGSPVLSTAAHSARRGNANRMPLCSPIGHHSIPIGVRHPIGSYREAAKSPSESVSPAGMPENAASCEIAVAVGNEEPKTRA